MPDEEIEMSPDEVEAEFIIPDNFKKKKSLFAFRKFRKDLNAIYLEREEIIDALLCCLLSSQHALLIGGKGTGKSGVAEAMLEAIKGGSYYKTQFWSTTTPEVPFGPPNLRIMQEDGEVVHNTKGKLADVMFAVINEIFDANDSMLRALLELLHPNPEKRTFTNGPTIMQLPLRSLIGTTNFSRDDSEELDAVKDRFAVICDVPPVSSVELKTAILRNEDRLRFTVSPLNLSAIDSLAIVVSAVKVKKSVYMKLAEIHTRLEARQINTSMRKLGSALKLVKAHAVLNGRTYILDTDFSIVKYCLTDSSRYHPVFSDVAEKAIQYVNDSLKSPFVGIKTSSPKAKMESHYSNLFKSLKKEFEDVGSIKIAREVHSLTRRIIELRIGLRNEFSSDAPWVRNNQTAAGLMSNINSLEQDVIQYVNNLS